MNLKNSTEIELTLNHIPFYPLIDLYQIDTFCSRTVNRRKNLIERYIRHISDRSLLESFKSSFALNGFLKLGEVWVRIVLGPGRYDEDT